MYNNIIGGKIWIIVFIVFALIYSNDISKQRVYHFYNSDWNIYKIQIVQNFKNEFIKKSQIDKKDTVFSTVDSVIIDTILRGIESINCDMIYNSYTRCNIEPFDIWLELQCENQGLIRILLERIDCCNYFPSENASIHAIYSIIDNMKCSVIINKHTEDYLKKIYVNNTMMPKSQQSRDSIIKK